MNLRRNSESRTLEDEVRYEQLRADLARAVRRICPAWLADRRDDLVQAAVMRVMDVEAKSEGNRDLGTSYLYRVAHSTLVDEIRRHRRRREVALEEEEGEEPVVPDADPGADRATESREIGRGIHHCLQGIKAERRLALVLYLQGHTVPECARHLGWSAKRTENLVYRGLASLRDCLMRKGLKP